MEIESWFGDLSPQKWCEWCGQPVNLDARFCCGECDTLYYKEYTEHGLRPPYEDTYRCPVCNSVNDMPGCCSKECYDLWTAPDDPEDYANLFR